MTHFVTWRGLDEWRAETAEIELQVDGLTATGVQLGAGYRLDYRLDASAGFITRSLELVATGAGWRRSLELRHDGRGGWSEPGLEGALDCDLAFSPLTNSMPIHRSGLHRRAGAQDFLMAWVEVPSLRVFASAQRYEGVREGVVRYVDDDFAAELELDGEGLVLRYPELAERVQPTVPPTVVSTEIDVTGGGV
jgi:hypothetical protein